MGRRVAGGEPGRRTGSAERPAGPSPVGSVAVDVGGDRGALVVEFDAAFEGAELEISPEGGAWDGTHTAVRRRQAADGPRFAAVYGSLPAGSYRLRPRAGSGLLRGEERGEMVEEVAVTGGKVTTLTWSRARVGAGR